MSIENQTAEFGISHLQPISAAFEGHCETMTSLNGLKKKFWKGSIITVV
jgi:hypothetical protein